MTIRFKTASGATFLLPDPVVIETHLSGYCFRVPHYELIHRDGRSEHVPFHGDFRLSDCILCESVEEQLEMQTVAA